jgi:phosphohistidine phosphatase
MVTNGPNEKTLTFEGKAEVERVGEALAMLKIKPDTIITSPLKRSYQTAEIIDSILFDNKNRKSRKSHQIGRFQVWNDLAPEGDPAKVFEKLSKFKYDSKILVVGHEPFLSELIYEVLNTAAYNNIVGTSNGDSSNGRHRRHNHSSPPSTPFLNNVDRGIVLKKSGLAKLRIFTKGRMLTGELRWLLTPKLLKKLSLAKKKSRIMTQKNLNMTTGDISPSMR